MFLVRYDDSFCPTAIAIEKLEITGSGMQFLAIYDKVSHVAAHKWHTGLTSFAEANITCMSLNGYYTVRRHPPLSIFTSWEQVDPIAASNKREPAWSVPSSRGKTLVLGALKIGCATSRSSDFEKCSFPAFQKRHDFRCSAAMVFIIVTNCIRY